MSGLKLIRSLSFVVLLMVSMPSTINADGYWTGSCSGWNYFSDTLDDCGDLWSYCQHLCSLCMDFEADPNDWYCGGEFFTTASCGCRIPGSQ